MFTISFNQDDVVEKVSGTPVLVMVYYEALCPDSKNFVLKQLKTSFDRAPDLMEIQLIPYGKATVCAIEFKICITFHKRSSFY